MKVTLENHDWWNKRFKRYSAAAKGSNDMKPVMKAGIMAANRIWDNIFSSLGSRFGGVWKQPSPITKILRSRGSRRTYVSIQEAKAHKVKPLRDTKTGQKSFGSTSGDGILEITGNSAMTGSKKKYMLKHNTGGKSKFIFSEQVQSRFKKNFEQKVNGEWNKEWFILWNWMKKVSGKTFTIPKRRIEPGPGYITTKEKNDIHKAMDVAMTELEKEIGLV